MTAKAPNSADAASNVSLLKGWLFSDPHKIRAWVWMALQNSNQVGKRSQWLFIRTKKVREQTTELAYDLLYYCLHTSDICKPNVPFSNSCMMSPDPCHFFTIYMSIWRLHKMSKNMGFNSKMIQFGWFEVPPFTSIYIHNGQLQQTASSTTHTDVCMLNALVCQEA